MEGFTNISTTETHNYLEMSSSNVPEDVSHCDHGRVQVLLGSKIEAMLPSKHRTSSLHQLKSKCSSDCRIHERLSNIVALNLDLD